MIVAVAANVRGTTPLFLPPSNDQFLRGKNNGATSIIIYQQRERRSALCYAPRSRLLNRVTSGTRDSKACLCAEGDLANKGILTEITF